MSNDSNTFRGWLQDAAAAYKYILENVDDARIESEQQDDLIMYAQEVVALEKCIREQTAWFRPHDPDPHKELRHSQYERL